MNIAIRVDASKKIGAGHFMRCLALADTFKTHGAFVRFICCEPPTYLVKILINRGYEYVNLIRKNEKRAAGKGTLLGHLSDATRTARALEDRKWNWLVVDHYKLDNRWESQMRDVAKRILAIDDLADRIHDCDILLDQTPSLIDGTRYLAKIPPDCLTMLGSKYTLLDLKFRTARFNGVRIRKKIERILIFFSTANSKNLISKCLEACFEVLEPTVAIDVVLSSDDSQEKIRGKFKGQRNIKFYEKLPTLLDLLLSSDFAIGAGGVATWERLCTGIPSAVITLAENQIPTAVALQKLNLINWIGHYDQISKEDIKQAIKAALNDKNYSAWSKRCLDYVDGYGAERIYRGMIAYTTDKLTARPATVNDENILLNWANDPETRNNAIVTDEISSETHKRWFAQRLVRPDSCRIYIVEDRCSNPIGQVRIEQIKEYWEIDYSLSKPLRSFGLGEPLLRAGLSQFFWDVEPCNMVVGQIKADNYPSMKIFTNIGFDLMRTPNSKYVFYYLKKEAYFKNPSNASERGAHAR